jgi:putative inorganic carbon (hco3(-)) transporter
MRDLLFTAVFVLLLPICFFRPWIGILVWAWIGFMNPHRLGWGYARNLPVALWVGGAVLLGLLFTKDRKPIPRSGTLLLMYLLLGHFCLTTFFSMVPERPWLHLEMVFKIILMTVVSTVLIYGKRRIELYVSVIALSIGFYGFKGGIFTFVTGGLYRVRGPEDSFIASNNDLSLALVMIIPVLVFLARDLSKAWMRYGLRLTALLSIVSAIFSYSRGALLGLGVILPQIFIKSKRKIGLILLLMPALYLFMDFAPEKLFYRAETISTYDQDGSAMQRLQAWSVSWNLACERPIVGGGFDISYLPDSVWMSYADRKYDQWGNVARASHSIYFQILGEHGFVGLALFLSLLLWALLELQKIKKAAAHAKDCDWIMNYANAIQIGLTGYAVSGAFLSLAYFDLFYAFVTLAPILKRELEAKTSFVEASQHCSSTPDAPEIIFSGLQARDLTGLPQ